MYQELVANLTAAHLRTHVAADLSTLEAEFTGEDRVRLTTPTISAVSLVGGVIQAPVEALPLIGVDCLDKDVIPSNESLTYYQYQGAIVGMMSGSSEEITDRAVKRYARMVEGFIRRHMYMHEDFTQATSQPFRFREFQFSNTRFSGSMEIELEESQPIWVAGFTVNCFWVTVEDMESQH